MPENDKYFFCKWPVVSSRVRLFLGGKTFAKNKTYE